MTGPDHYREAEGKLEFAHRITKPDSGLSDEDATKLVGLALPAPRSTPLWLSPPPLHSASGNQTTTSGGSPPENAPPPD